MHSDADMEAREGRRRKFGAGLALSVVLHGLAFAALIFILKGAAAPLDSSLVVPVDIVQLADQIAGPIEPKTAIVPKEKSGPPSSPPTKSVALAPHAMKPPPSDLEVKLRKLAQLREPVVDTHISQNGEGLSRVSTMRERTAFGAHATIKDFLRAQIERHWAPDLEILHGRSISVLIRVAFTSVGVVTKAEVVNAPEVGVDPAYDEIAFSARNAALLSSPLTLPPGRYARSMDVILSLNTRDALR
jgi:hypothetical protein